MFLHGSTSTHESLFDRDQLIKHSPMYLIGIGIDTDSEVGSVE